jgi:hypothetical protein
MFVDLIVTSPAMTLMIVHVALRMYLGYRLYQRFSSCGAIPSGGAVAPLGGGSCMYERYIYFEQNMGAT